MWYKSSNMWYKVQICVFVCAMQYCAISSGVICSGKANKMICRAWLCGCCEEKNISK